MTSFLLNKRATGGTAGRGSVPRGNLPNNGWRMCVALASPEATALVVHWAAGRIKPDPTLGDVWCQSSGVLQRGGNDWLWVTQARRERLLENRAPILNDGYEWIAPADLSEHLSAKGLKVGLKVTSIRDGDCLIMSSLLLHWVNHLLGNTTPAR